MISIYLIDAHGFCLRSLQVPEGIQHVGSVTAPLPAIALAQGKQWCWSGSKWIQAVNPTLDRVQPVPFSVTAYQAKVALDDAGLYEAVLALINHADTPLRVKLAWDQGLDFQRNNQMVLLITEQLGLSESDLDALFIAAGNITPGAL